jgi:hypothetical protein
MRLPLLSIFSRIPKMRDFEAIELIQIDGSVIAGALILLTLTTTQSSPLAIDRSEITYITAGIVFPFAISALVAVFGIDKNIRFRQFPVRLMVAGFANLMISITLLIIMGY